MTYYSLWGPKFDSFAWKRAAVSLKGPRNESPQSVWIAHSASATWGDVSCSEAQRDIRLVHILAHHLQLAFRCLPLLFQCRLFAWTWISPPAVHLSINCVLMARMDTTYLFHLILTHKFVFVCLFYVFNLLIGALAWLDVSISQSYRKMWKYGLA